MTRTDDEETLDLMISYVLIAGVVLSIIVETMGLVTYYSVHRSLSIDFQSQNELDGTNFFAFSTLILQNVFHNKVTPFEILALGIVLLMITPYLRVVASVIYFGAVRNLKYLVITVFVLIILTASLLIH